MSATKSPSRWQELDLPPRIAAEISRRAAASSELIFLGSLDNDGRFLSNIGAWPDLPKVDEADFVPRYRFSLDLVVHRDVLAVRKDFRGDRASCSREVGALTRLAGRANTPRLLHTDLARTVLLKEFVLGPTLRDLLVSAGARILTAQAGDERELDALSVEERTELIWARGRRSFDRIRELDPLHRSTQDWRTALRETVQRLHGLGVSRFSLTFGNVVLHRVTGQPWLIDFDKAAVTRWRWSPWHILAKRADSRLLTRIYGPPPSASDRHGGRSTVGAA